MAPCPNCQALLDACREFVRFSELPDTIGRGEYIRYQVKALAAARNAIKATEGKE